jgi:hypothetical protein
LATELEPGDRIVGAIPNQVAHACPTCGYSAMELSYWLDKLGVDSTFMSAPTSDARRLLVVVNLDDSKPDAGEELRHTVEQTAGASAPTVIAEFPQAMVLSVQRGPQ